MQLQVKNIASVQFRHQYFAPEGFDWDAGWPETYNEALIPVVLPTVATKAKMEDFGLYFRASKYGFDLYAAVRKTGSDFFTEKSAKQNATLYFYVIKPFLAWDYSTRNLASAIGLTVFSNLNGFHSGGGETRYLHNEVIASAAGDKQPGTLVRKGNKVYEALQKTNSQPPSANWNEVGEHIDFTTLSNNIPLNTGIVRLQETSLANKVFTVHDIYDSVVFEKVFLADTTEKETGVAIDMLPEGIYSYRLDGTEKGKVYLAKQVPNATFGILAIALQGEPDKVPLPHKLDEAWLPIANGSQSLGQDQINPRTFAIHFMNNTAKWRYIFNKDIGIAPGDVPSTFKKDSATLYESKKAIPILAGSAGPDFGLDQRLPAPAVGRLTPQLNGSEELEAYVSEIYVNV